MTDPAPQLLDGPRGRRLCLEYMRGADDAVASAVFRLAHRLDPNPGTLIRFRRDAGDEPEEDPDVTAEELAALIRRVEPAGLRPEVLREAFGASVDAARYWQEPDGADAAAALPVVRDALRPVAERIVEVMPDMAAPRGAMQWAVDWRTAEDSAPLPRDPAAVLADWTRGQRTEETRAAWDRPADPRANFSGTWWSVPQGLLTTRGSIADALELVEDPLGWDVATVIPVRGTGRTLEIRSTEDWADLCREHPMEVTASRRHDWFRVTGREGRWLIPDWERVAAQWDAVHLTTLGYLSAATCLIEIDAEYGTVIGGWGPDATIWLRDTAREADEPRRQFARPRNSRLWTSVPGVTDP